MREAMREIASGLQFPEGPIAMPDGSVILVEIARGTLSRVSPAGKVEVVAETGGGPNGAAIGPGGAVYVCNNGGFQWRRDEKGRIFPGPAGPDYSGGRIERIDPATGKVERLYEACNGLLLKGPNDIVFDAQGYFWFTDHGKSYGRTRDIGAIYCAAADGSMIHEAVHPLLDPNGIGLSPDGKWLYAAESASARLWRFPTEEAKTRTLRPGPEHFVAAPGGFQFFDSLALQADGAVCVATIYNGGITTIEPETAAMRHTPADDRLTTNICFGGAELKTAWITLSSTSRLVSTPWPSPGCPLHFLNL